MHLSRFPTLGYVQRLYDFLRRHPMLVDGFWAVVLLGLSAASAESVRRAPEQHGSFAVTMIPSPRPSLSFDVDVVATTCPRVMLVRPELIELNPAPLPSLNGALRVSASEYVARMFLSQTHRTPCHMIRGSDGAGTTR